MPQLIQLQTVERKQEKVTYKLLDILHTHDSLWKTLFYMTIVNGHNGMILERIGTLLK